MESQQDMVRKRDRTEEQADSGISFSNVNTPEKKGKMAVTTLNLSNLEVGASSLNWAQFNR